jgi:hypothetical protein
MDQALTNYFKENSKIYTIDILKSEALKSGNSQTDIDEVCNHLEFNKSGKIGHIFTFYILPILTFVIFSYLFIQINLEHKAFSLFLNSILFIISLFSFLFLFKKSMCKSRLFLYSFFTIILIPLISSLSQLLIFVYGKFLTLLGSELEIQPEIVSNLDTSILFIFIFYSIILGLFSYKFIYSDYLNKKPKFLSIILGIIISSLILFILIYLKEIFSTIILDSIGIFIG